MATTSSMFMYSFTVQPSSASSCAILGQFTGTKEQLIITASGSRITLHRPDAQQNKLVPVTTHDVFGIVRNLASLRLAGTPKDYIIIGSDSGRIAIIEYLPTRNRFQRIHLETFGKSGIRRVVPGQFLVTDPKGRAAMLASMEKNKVVYILNRNAQAELTISSPLSADKPHTLVYAMVGLDVGYENPIFAALEIDYAEAEQDSTNNALGDIEKQLVYYELDLGLNHVVRKWTEPVDRTANFLFQVPGGNDGPSGVLVCSEEFITYRHQNQAPYRVAIPRRLGATEDPSRKRCITAGVMHKMRGAFFFLLQSEDGDLFKVTIDMVEDDNGEATGEVRQLKIKYFDTVPVATNLCVLKSGYLFVATESGNHHFYQFEKLGDEDGEPEFTSDMFNDTEEEYTPVRFRPRKYENLLLAESIDSLHPLMGAKTYNLAGEDVPQIYTICGTGARSSFKTLKQGLEISEIADSELPKVPTAVWTIKKQRSDEFDAYIVLSFTNGTLVLSIGETVEEASDTGFLTSTPTLAAQLLGEDSLIQIHPKGIRHILAGGAVNQWEAPQHRSIVAAATNERQVAIALSSGELIYFELDADGSLAEYDEKREMSGTVTCLSLGDVPEGRQRSEFLAVGCDDATVRILSLGVESTLESKSIQALSSAPVSLRIMAMPDPSSGGTALYLHIGLYSGVYIRTVLDEVTGDLSDTRTRFLGPKPCRLFQATVKGEAAILALTTRSWLGYSDTQTSNFTLAPLNYSPLEWASNFTSSQCKEGIVGIQAKNLRIFMVERLSTNLLRESIPLAYTPRDFVRHPDYPLFYIIQADNNVLPENLREELLSDPSLVNGDAVSLEPVKFGYPKGLGHWSSCIQIVDPVTVKSVIETVQMEKNEAAVSVAAVSFDSQDGETFLLVGTGQDMKFAPRSSTAGYIHVYRFQDDGRSLEFIHKTQVEEPPYSLIPFQGRLLAGIGSTVRLYDLGMRQLLRKAQLMKAVPSVIVDMKSSGSRIVVGDAQEGVTYLVYKLYENRLIKFVDDTVKRWTTCINVVDYETTAGGDKFGNIWLVRCPPRVSDSADEEGAGTHLVHDRGWLHGTPQRLDLMIHNYVQDMPTSIEKVSLLSGSAEVLLWSGLQGSVGVLAPIPSREEVEFFLALEAELRKDDPPLAGRDHLIYRSYYNPVKGVIDGDLCERFLFLSRDLKDRIAGELDRSVREIERKISEMRTRSAF